MNGNPIPVTESLSRSLSPEIQFPLCGQKVLILKVLTRKRGIGKAFFTPRSQQCEGLTAGFVPAISR